MVGREYDAVDNVAETVRMGAEIRSQLHNQASAEQQKYRKLIDRLDGR